MDKISQKSQCRFYFSGMTLSILIRLHSIMISCQYSELGAKKIETQFNAALRNVKEIKSVQTRKGRTFKQQLNIHNFLPLRRSEMLINLDWTKW